jgi:hypothetical protein
MAILRSLKELTPNRLNSLKFTAVTTYIEKGGYHE